MNATEFSNKENSESSTEQDKENSFVKTEPRRVKIFDGGQVLCFVYLISLGRYFFVDSRLCKDVASCLIYFKQQFPYCGL